MFTPRRDFFQRIALFFSGLAASSPSQAAQSPAGPRPKPEAAPQPYVSPDEELVRAEFDLIVVGGGIAGACTAISAARNGVRVALVHNRSMLGGNSSSEVKLFPENNSGHQPWIREGGIHDEFHTEERVRNHQDYMEGTMNAHWDLVLYEWAMREKNLTLYLNTHMHRAVMAGPNRIHGIYAIQLGTEKSFDLSAPLFADCTGDGVLAHRAKADYRWGRESRAEYGEPQAPETADDNVMGNTLFFRAVDTGRPAPFKLPDWAASFPREEDLTSRNHSYIDGGYWWIEVGAPYHPIKDNEAIRHEALRQLLGVWDHIKNRGDHGAENYGLEFVGFWPYKRECRRILGDYVITQQHVQDPPNVEDAVAHGAWGIDIHTQRGINARDEKPYPPPKTDANNESLATMVYPIPLRSLYSRNIDNLYMAGRPISCTYTAFASTRVLSTGAIVGEAVGVAASLSKKYAATPREVADKHIVECQQGILRQDVHIPGVENQDPNDLARRATATASSEWWLEFPETSEGAELRYPHGQIFPVAGDRIDTVELYLENRGAAAARIPLGLRAAPHVSDFRSTEDLATVEAEIPAGYSGWVPFTFNASVEPGKLYWVHVPAQRNVLWRQFREVDGRPNLNPVGATAADRPGPSRWRPKTMGRILMMRVTPRQQVYSALNVIRGTHRPDRWTNIWISDPGRRLPAWLELQWPSPVSLTNVQVTFDTDANRRITLPLFRYPDCVKDYRLEHWAGGGWRALAEVKGNYARRREHRFARTSVDRLRLFVSATNGATCGRVYEIRAYDEA